MNNWLVEDVEENLNSLDSNNSIDSRLGINLSVKRKRSNSRNSSAQSSTSEISTINADSEINLNSSHLSLKLAIELVPVFDGKSESLTKFIKQCKIADASVHPKDKFNLLILMRNRIKGFADKLILHKKDPKNLDDLIKNLKTCFTKTFDVDSTHAELKSQKQEKNENINVFGARINDLLDRALEAVKERFDAAQAMGVSVMLNHAAITGFSLGLRDRTISTLLNSQKLDSLEEAISMATKLGQKNDDRNALFGFNSFNTFTQLNNQPNNLSYNNQAKIFVQSNIPNNQTNFDGRYCFKCYEQGHIQRNCPKNNFDFKINEIEN